MSNKMLGASFALCLTVASAHGQIASVGSYGEASSTASQSSPSHIMVYPMTNVNSGDGTGYFQDPYPIHTLVSEVAGGLPIFSGTTMSLLSCAGLLPLKCSASTPVTLDPGPFAQRATAAGAVISNYENLNIFQDRNGGWQMAVTVHLTKKGSNGWNAILHAHPISPGLDIPRAWQADAILVGDFSQPYPDNYDGKYFEDAGVLYLIYNRKIGTNQDAVVAQAMTTPIGPAASDPVTLLGPETNDGGYNSELAYGLSQSNPVKLIETGNIMRIGGKYVMTYSVGTYNRNDYKAGIAWSDTFIPRSGIYYRRINKFDTKGVWGLPNHIEVQYLLQSQISDWPNYVLQQVIAPGVPAIVRDVAGAYFLTFAGYDPNDAPVNQQGLYQGSHRRPFFVRLKVRIPEGASVLGSSIQNLAKWVEIVGSQ